MASQLDISCGTQERFTPVKQPRFGICKRCTTLKVEMKREQAKVKRLESVRKSDQKRFEEEMMKQKNEHARLKQAYMDEHKVVLFLKGLHEKIDSERRLLMEERDRLFKRM